MIKHNTARMALIVAALLLAGCLPGLRGEVSPIQVVSPDVRIVTDPNWPQVDMALNVRRPQANQMLDGFGLLVRQDRHKLMTYPGLAWPDATADLLQGELIKGLLDSRGFSGGVGRPGEIRAHGTLITNIRHFELVDNGPGDRNIRLEVSALLTRNQDARQVASENFLVTRPVAATDTTSILDGFEAAITELVQQVVGWTLTEADTQKRELQSAVPSG